MKAIKIAGIVFTVLASGMAIFSGVVKLIGGEQVVTTLQKAGVADNQRVLLGLMEIVFGILFAIPQTMKLGFILLSCYFAGALATEISHSLPTNAFTPLILVWIAAFLRDKYIFLPSPKTLA